MVYGDAFLSGYLPRLYGIGGAVLPGITIYMDEKGLLVIGSCMYFLAGGHQDQRPGLLTNCVPNHRLYYIFLYLIICICVLFLRFGKLSPSSSKWYLIHRVKRVGSPQLGGVSEVAC